MLKRKKEKKSIIEYKILYTILIVCVYIIGKNIPLYNVDLTGLTMQNINAEALLMQTISGDIHQSSIFALGIAPYMMSSIVVQILNVFRSSENRSKISTVQTNRLTIIMMFIIALVQAQLRVEELQFVTGNMYLNRYVATLELVTGAMMILWLCTRNKKYGIGGQSALILVNVVDGIRVSLKGHEIEVLLIPVLISLGVMAVMVFMENKEKRIPLQRISIHNIYADNNYLAIKLNPIGVMPAMFSTAFFMIPQMLCAALCWIMPQNETLLWCKDNMALDKHLGIFVYVLILYTLTIGFSRVFINPKDLMEQYLKSGDSLVGIHAGKDTKRYISKWVTIISLCSAVVMSTCLVIPMLLQMNQIMDNTLASLPSSIMILTGIWCNIYSEIEAVKAFDEYKAFV